MKLDLSGFDKALEEEDKQEQPTLDLSGFDQAVQSKQPAIDLSGFDQAQQEQPSAVEAFGRGVAQGATLSWADEITAGIESLVTDKPYRQALEESRKEYEKSAKARPGATLAGQVVGGIGTALIPGLQVASVAKGASFAKTMAAAGKAGAVFGGIEGAGRSVAQTADEIMKDAAQGAAIGAAASIGLGAAGKGVQAALQKPTKKVLNFLEDARTDIANGARKVLQERADKESQLKSLFQSLSADDVSIPDEMVGEVAEFGKFLAKQPVGLAESKKLIRRAIKDNAFEGQLAAYRGQQAMLDYIDKEAVGTLSQTMPGIRRMVNMLIDTQYVYQQIDDKLGTELQPLMNNLSNADRATKGQIYRLSKKYIEGKNGLRAMLSKADADEQRLFQAIDKGQMDGLTANDQAIVRQVRAITEDMLDSYQQLGLPVKRRENYFPSRMVNAAEYVNRIDDKVRAVITKHADDADPSTWLRQLDQDDVSGLYRSDDDFKDLIDGLTLGYGQAIDGIDLVSKLKSIRNPIQLSNRMETEADALFRRADLIPDFLRDTNIERTLLGSAYTNFRHAYMRDSLAELAAHIPILKRLGDQTSAEYLSRHVADIAGRRSTMITDAMHTANLQWRIKLGDAIRDAESPAAKTVLGFMRDTPDFLSSLANNVYVNFLGLNTKAFVRNLAQPYVMTAAQLTGDNPAHIARATKYALKGSRRMLATMRKRGMGVPDMKRELGNYAPPEFTAEARTALEQALRSGSKTQMLPEAYRRMGQMAMKMYEASDIYNRYTTVHMAKELTKDLLKGDKVAKAMVDRMARGYRSKIAAAKGPDEIQHLITDYLIATTQFNYDRISLSEFGRTFGPVFSVFTKWPTSIAGDIITTMMRKDEKFRKRMMTVGMKYMGPLLAAGGIDALFFGPEMRPEQHQYRVKKMVGADGFTSWMPIKSLEMLVSGDIMTPPVVEQGGQLAKALLSDKPNAMPRWVADTFYSFAPGAVIARSIFKDYPGLVENERDRRVIEEMLKGD